MQVAFEVRNRETYKPVFDAKEAVDLNRLPEPKGEERSYLVSLDKECPVGFVSLLGQVSFHKYLSTPQSREGGNPLPVFLVYNLTSNQLEAVKLAAKRKKIRVREGGYLKEIPVERYIKIEELPVKVSKDKVTSEELQEILMRATKEASKKEKKQ